MSELRVRKLDEKIHEKLRIEAIKQKISLEQLVRNILEDYVKKIKN